MILVVGFATLSMVETISSQLRVSEAHVVVIVDHNSEDDTLAMLVILVVGFDVLVKAIIYCFDTLLPFVSAGHCSVC